MPLTSSLITRDVRPSHSEALWALPCALHPYYPAITNVQSMLSMLAARKAAYMMCSQATTLRVCRESISVIYNHLKAGPYGPCRVLCTYVT